MLHSFGCDDSPSTAHPGSLMRLRLSALIALALLAGPAAAQEEARGILFATQRIEPDEDGGDAVLEPVVLLWADDILVQPPYEDDEVAAFNARWLPTGREYAVLSAGVAAGRVRVTTAEAPACSGLGARGTLQLRTRPAEGWQGLAGEGLPEQAGAPWLRAASAAERRELDRMAAALFAAHGTDLGEVTRADTTVSALVVHPNARPILIGSYRMADDRDLLRQWSTLIIAEDGERGYRPLHAWFHGGIVDDVESRALVDAVDLDGEGMPELVVRNAYYESWDYIIYRRVPAGWMALYRGGGGGC